jgi:hypothetical protein
MKSHGTLWRQIFRDWKLILLLAFPIFIPAMWYGISQRFEDLWLFGAAMALGSIHVAEMALITFRRARELFSKKAN